MWQVISNLLIVVCKWETTLSNPEDNWWSRGKTWDLVFQAGTISLNQELSVHYGLLDKGGGTLGHSWAIFSLTSRPMNASNSSILKVVLDAVRMQHIRSTFTTTFTISVCSLLSSGAYYSIYSPDSLWPEQSTQWRIMLKHTLREIYILDVIIQPSVTMPTKMDYRIIP